MNNNKPKPAQQPAQQKKTEPKSPQQRLKDGVSGGSRGRCTRIVINAIKGESNLYGEECGVKDAVEAIDFLLDNGYKVYNGKDPIPGVVRIYLPTREHKYGHIQMYCNDKKWRSDFEQKNTNPWVDGTTNDKYKDYIPE